MISVTMLFKLLSDNVTPHWDKNLKKIKYVENTENINFRR